VSANILTLFNIKGIQFLLETGFISSKTPQDIATFLMHTEGLSKTMIGEYLGEGCVVFQANASGCTDVP
jgi:Sec7-like guanine-nucleotide exchange factor